MFNNAIMNTIHPTSSNLWSHYTCEAFEILFYSLVLTL